MPNKSNANAQSVKGLTVQVVTSCGAFSLGCLLSAEVSASLGPGRRVSNGVDRDLIFLSLSLSLSLTHCVLKIYNRV